MHHLDTTSGKSRNTRLILSALRAANKNQSRLALTCVLGAALPLGAGTALASNTASASLKLASTQRVALSESTTHSPWILAAVAEGDKPAAAPQENPPALAVPVTPDKSPQPTPHMPPPEANTPPAPAVPPVTPPSAPSAPATPTTSPFLNPAVAEGMEIADVRVAGNRVVPNNSILLQINGTKPGAKFSIRQAEADRLSILNLGFFASAQYQITPDLNDPSKIDVVFVVVENRVVTGFRIEGNSLIKSDAIIAALVSQKGAVLNSQNVAKDSKAIQDLYRQQGYAALVSDVRQEDDGTTVFVIQEGKVSRIEISGLKKTNESIVRGLIATKKGDPFNEKKLQKDLNRIYDTGFFEDVTYKINDDPDHPGALIITIVVKEKRTGQLSLGVGFDNRSKISGYVSLGDNNFRGTGRSISGEVQLGSIQSFQVSMGDPFVGKNNASYNVSIYSTTSYLEPQTVNLLTGNPTTYNYEQQRTGGRINYTLPLDFDHTTNILFGYRNEKVKLFQYDNSNDDPVDVPFNDSDGRISAFSLGFLHDNRDLRLDPSTGGREQIIVEKGFSFLGGNEKFTKFDVDLRRYIPLMKPEKKGDLPKLVLAGRIVYGHSLGNLPTFEQYFIGGSDTVRGYDTDAQFGDNQIYGNLELRYRVNKKFQFVAFTDAGSAYGGNSSYPSLDLIASVGVGIRLQTPIGPIRLDVGKGDDGLKTSFGIGPTF
jgi:outer membrane protein insertion porin family